MMKKSCPFCEDNIYEISFAESENFLAIYNIAPILPGHSLIIPKKHITSFLDFTNAELSELVLFSRQTVDILLRAFNCEGFNISLQEKEEAGQSIEHFHLHVIPRKPKDLSDPGGWYKKIKDAEQNILDSPDRKRLSREEMIEMAEYIRKV